MVKSSLSGTLRKAPYILISFTTFSASFSPNISVNAFLTLVAVEFSIEFKLLLVYKLCPINFIASALKKKFNGITKSKVASLLLILLVTFPKLLISTLPSLVPKLIFPSPLVTQFFTSITSILPAVSGFNNLVCEAILYSFLSLKYIIKPLAETTAVSL